MLKVFKNLYNYRELLKTNVKKEIRGKYKNSFLGVLWSFLNPLLQIVVYAVVFQLILKNTKENYAIFICCGLIPWTFFSSAISRAAFTMVENGNIIKKVYFPREILPISIVTSEAVTFLISTLIIIGFVVFGGIGISKYIIFYPLVLLAQYLLLIAISFIVSSISVYVRDLQHLIGVVLQLLFYATPIVYAAEAIPENEKATVQVLNNSDFSSMYHVVTIKVTAENGITNKEYKVIAKKIKDGNSEDEEENEGGLESNTEKTEEVSNEIDENDESKDEILDEENVNLNKENEKEQNNYNSTFIVIGIVVGVLIIAFIIYMIRKKKK